MLSLLLFALSADVALEARAPVADVRAVLPASDTTVAQNGRLVFIGAGDATFVRITPAADGTFEESTLAHSALFVDQFEGAHVIDLAPLELAIGDQLVVAARCGSCTFQGTWTVAQEDSAAPTFDDGPARVTGEHIGYDIGGTSGGWFITVELPGARDESSQTMIELRGDVNLVAPQAFAQGTPISVFVTDLDDSERTACFDAVAFDAAGNEATFRDELCVELTRPLIGGCAQASSSTPMFAGALVLLALLRARRSRA
jgi:hypothetical protein